MCVCVCVCVSVTIALSLFLLPFSIPPSLPTAAVFVVSFLLTGFNIWAALVILGIVTSIILHMLGSMYVLKINANAVSLVNLVMVSPYIRC